MVDTSLRMWTPDLKSTFCGRTRPQQSPKRCNIITPAHFLIRPKVLLALAVMLAMLPFQESSLLVNRPKSLHEALIAAINNSNSYMSTTAQAHRPANVVKSFEKIFQ